MQRVLVALCFSAAAALVPNGVAARAANAKAPLKVLFGVHYTRSARRRGTSVAARVQRIAAAALVCFSRAKLKEITHSAAECAAAAAATHNNRAPHAVAATHDDRAPARHRRDSRRPRTGTPSPRRPTPAQAATFERAAPTAPIFSDVCSETGVTLSRFMIETALANPELRELESIFSSIETASKTISNLVRRSALTGLTGYLDSGNINIQGEEQKKLDVITNEVLKNALRYTGRMGVLASEEEDAPVEVDDDLDERYKKEIIVEKTTGKYVAVFDPLDGSSNVDAGIPTGTIFGIFEDKQDECDLSNGDLDACLESTLQPVRGGVRFFVMTASAAARRAPARRAAVDTPSNHPRRATPWWRRATCSTAARRTSS